MNSYETLLSSGERHGIVFLFALISSNDADKGDDSPAIDKHCQTLKERQNKRRSGVPFCLY